MKPVDCIPPFEKAWLAPKYWASWIGLGFLWLLGRLPVTWHWPLSKTFAKMFSPLLKRPRHIARTNFALAFPEKSPQEREALVRAHMAHFILVLFETSLSWWPRQGVFPRLLKEIRGLEHLTQAQASGRGVIILSAHFINLEIAGPLLHLHTDFAVSFTQQRNPIWNRAMIKGRHRYFQAMFDKDQMRPIVKFLKSSGVLWYAPDLNFKGKLSAKVNFFGQPVHMPTSTPVLAKMTDAIVLPMFNYRVDGQHHLELAAPIPIPSGNDQADTQLFSDLIEAQIRRHPEQYFWTNKRFKGITNYK